MYISLHCYFGLATLVVDKKCFVIVDERAGMVKWLRYEYTAGVGELWEIAVDL